MKKFQTKFFCTPMPWYPYFFYSLSPQASKSDFEKFKYGSYFSRPIRARVGTFGPIKMSKNCRTRIWIFRRQIWITGLSRSIKHMDTMGVQKTFSETFSCALCATWNTTNSEYCRTTGWWHTKWTTNKMKFNSLWSW